MIKPDWNQFKVKFSENPQDNFEWFCYLLFCEEFDKPYGIFRYKNQSAIENNPIKQGKDFIGWQAKFYETALSNHKKKLLEAIEKAKRDYPNITKLLFYTNEQWGQDKGKKPKGLLEIEQKAQSLNIKLKWRAKSFFESKFVSIDNELISRHFFTSDNGVFNIIEEQRKHTENVLNKIKTFINFNNQSFEIDRNEEVVEIINNLQQVLIISGVGGVGKTALIKELYQHLKQKSPLYIFNANEFDLRNISDFFNGISVNYFIEAHSAETKKIIVIDSAEKLRDLKNTDPFKEFLSIFIESKWKIIFTTRDGYTEDLNYPFFEIYKIVPLNIKVKKLTRSELNDLAEKNCFTLPKDVKLFELITTPFYLNEYLQFYKDEELDYFNFKHKLWDRVIKKYQPAREIYFLLIAFERASNGQFFINPNCEPNILDNELVKDGVLGYETAGYFITHDIYEEWALEKIIEREFVKHLKNQEFFNEIGQSFPIRRSFRNWLSEKLLLEDEKTFNFIENVIQDNEIEAFWKDEILISILLSDYSDTFFRVFKTELLSNNQELLNKLTFLLRVACKEVDDSFFKQLGVKNVNLLSLKHILTRPKGQGWISLINFVFENLDTIGIKNINFVLPVIYDWNNKFKKGKTVKLSGLIALQYYQWIIEEDVYHSRDDSNDNLLKTIIYGVSEIKDELKEIFEEIVKNKWKKHRDPYYDLSKTILTTFEGVSITNELLNNVLQIADLFWSNTPKQGRFYTNSGMDVDNYFGIEENRLDYFPVSAYQTPIYWLLQSSLKDTVNFILDFTNKTVTSFAKSDFAKNEVDEIDVFIDENIVKKQYICHRLWCTYRGTQASPDVIESMYMALEKNFLEQGKNADSKTLEYWLIYLLKNTRSSAISAIVASIVLAHPEKTFSTAVILFKTKEFFFFDKSRLQLDHSVLCPSGSSVHSEFLQKERIDSKNLEHRKSSLESLFLNYQFFRSNEISDLEAEQRQEILWNLLDYYYDELPDEIQETVADKVWRLCLARMDRRKMKPTTEEKDGNLIINFNPKIDSKLKEYSENAQQINSDQIKYVPLRLWAKYKLEKDDKHKQYEQYEKNPQLALNEVREILSKLKSQENTRYSEDESFDFVNNSIPGDVCSVLAKNYFNKLSKEDKVFCKDVVVSLASSSFRENYGYHISDGVEATISVLPILLKEFPEEQESVKIILLVVLFDPNSIGAYKKFAAYSIEAIQHDLWETNFIDAQSLLLGYLLLKPKYEELRKILHEESYKTGVYSVQESQIIELFLKENESNLQKFVENKLSLCSLEDIEQLDLHSLKIAFQLIPLKTDNDDHKKIVKTIISAFTERLLSDDREDKLDYQLRHDFLEKLAYFVLSANKEEIQEYLLPFIDGFNSSESIADFFQAFILAEDRLNTYENFWVVWGLFREKIIKICDGGDKGWYVDKIVKSYLFAQVPWRNTTSDWHTLKDTDKRFFKDILQKIGHCPSALYAISKLLYDIGSCYQNDGISWVSEMLDSNAGLLDTKLEINTIYYLESLVRKHVYENREEVRKSKKMKEEVLVILFFLIAKGSVVGYILRENIL